MWCVCECVCFYWNRFVWKSECAYFRAYSVCVHETIKDIYLYALSVMIVVMATSGNMVDIMKDKYRETKQIYQVP